LGKLLFILVLAVAAYLVVRGIARFGGKVEPQKPKADEDMVRCRHCGLHLPRGESFMGGDNFYCCEEHRKLHVH